jgi:hypothetical protein
LFGVAKFELPISVSERSDVLAANVGGVVVGARSLIDPVVVTSSLNQHAVDAVVEAWLNMTI